MEQGYLAMVLHAHLPFVRHPEHEEFLEEDWLFEAITETYIPLLEVFENLYNDGVDFRITMTLSPSLCEMLSDGLLSARYVKQINKLCDLADSELERTRGQGDFYESAKTYEHKFKHARWVFCEKYKGNLINGFKKFQDLGCLEVITCGATHGFLPLMNTRQAVRAQIAVGANNYRKHFGRNPRGIWLPECAYSPGIDEELKREGIRYFFLDTHGIMFGSPRPRFGIFAPIYCPSGVAAFGRDTETSRQVWSAETGYPGDSNYREFYRDLGYDGHYDYIRPFLKSDGVRRNIGIKYYKITGKVGLNQKSPYNPHAAHEKAAEHAGNFLFNRQHQVRFLNSFLGRKPIVISPYDAELFGHWWFEGPDFINFIMRKASCDQDELKLITPSEYLGAYPMNQIVTPALSSWGDKGYFEVWLNGTNDWIYRHLHKCENRMTEMANRFPEAGGLLLRALNQAARELLLAQSSDWAFIMTTKTMAEYAEKRTKDHVHRFNGIYMQVMENRIEEKWIAELESKDNIFQEIDYRVYR